MRPVRLAAVAVVLALLAAAGPALGDPGKPGQDDAYPSREQVAAAKADAADKQAAVASIRAELLLANQRLERASTEAEQAAEAYNGARWRLQQAEEAAEQARADAAAARRTLATQRDAIAALVAASYQQAGDLTALSAMMSVEGPQGVLDQYAGFSSASSSLDADYQRFAATDLLARVFERKAERAEDRQRALAGQAKAAQEQAAAAAERAVAEAQAVADERHRLIGRLAKAQRISVELATQRQTALEEIARERAAEQARREAEAAARAKARAEARAAAKAKAADAAKAEKAAKAAKAAQAKKSAENKKAQAPQQDSTPSPAPATAPAPQPAPAPPSASSADAGAAIAFARTQLGEPYRWGAAGPDAWDCSGLMAGAWAAAGVSLPHYSAAQYDAGTPISAADLRPGDLVFWSSNGSPSGIHHVAMYLGDGMIIHAPRTGRPVAIDSLYYWVPPDLFVRL